MSFNVDKTFISKIVNEGNFLEVAGIPSYMILDPLYRDAFEYITQYYGDHGQCPTLRVFQADQPKVQVIPTPEPWSDIKERLVTNFKRDKLLEASDISQKFYNSGDVDGAIRVMSSALADIYTYAPSSRDVDITVNGDERMRRYEDRRNNPGFMVGIPTGFPTIDKATQGLQRGQLVTLTGLPKASKSTLALRIGMTVQESGCRVLYLTYEQTVEEQENRIDAYRAGFNDNLLNSGRYSLEQEAALKKGMEKTRSLPQFLISQDCRTVGEIAAKIDVCHPDVVIVDGVYMMDDEKGEKTGSPAALTNIVSSLKNLAMMRMICIVAVTQSTPARTKGEELNGDSIMGSRSFTQYSNVVLGVERTGDKDVRKMRVLLSRSCSPCEIMLVFDYDSGMFMEWENYDMDDAAEYEDEFDDQHTTALF